MSFGDVLSIPFASSPVVGISFSDDPVESAAGLLHRGFVVWSVAENHVNVVMLESLERVLYPFDHVFSRESAQIGDASRFSEIELSAEHIVMTRDIQSSDRLANLHFGLAEPIDFGSIKEVDA